MRITSTKKTNKSTASTNRNGSTSKVGVGILLVVVMFFAIYAWSNSTDREFDPSMIDPVLISSGEERANDSAETEAQTPLAETLPGILSGISRETIETAAHPLDPFLEIAHRAREKLLNEVQDYSAVLMNEIRTTSGDLREPQYLQIKIRHPREENGKQIPFSIYTRFLEPKELAGQEVIWVEGQNDGKLIAHPPKFNIKRFYLDPTGPLAMGDNRHPIYEIGLERLLAQIIEKGERDREAGMCEVEFETDVEVNGIRCLKLTVRHDTQQPPFDFHKAVIYVDIERQIPIGYEGFDWPAEAGGPPQLIERYFYSKIVLNNEFTDKDWDPSNRAYKFPRL
jgi:hypothetical protein